MCFRWRRRRRGLGQGRGGACEGVYCFHRVLCVVDRGVNDVERAVHVGNVVCVSQVVGNVPLASDVNYIQVLEKVDFP